MYRTFLFFRYVLRPPSDSDIKSYVDNVIEALVLQKDICNDIILKFSEVYGIKADSLSTAVKERTACRLLSKKMIHDALSIRKKHVGILLKSLRKIKSIQLVSEDDFLKGVHTVSSKPFFYDTGYKTTAPKQVTIVDHAKRCLATEEKIPQLDEYALCEKVIPVDDKGRCILSEQVGKEKTSDGRPKSWKCNELCKAFTDEEIQNILNIKKVFERPLEEVRAFLYEMDSGCQHGHYAKVIQSSDNSEYVKELLGHPIQCAAGMCESPLRLLRQAAVHHPKPSCEYIQC